MFTIECEDPNCMECKQAGKEQSSKEDNQSTMPKTVEESSKEGNQSKIPETAGKSSEEEVQRKLIGTIEEVIASDLYRANQARFVCLAKCNNLKARVSYEINELINILKQRERDLLSTIEGEYCGEVTEIDNDLTHNSIDKILNRFDETKSSRPKTTLVFNSDFDAMKRSLASFGKLTLPEIKERPKPSKVVTAKQIKEVQKMMEIGNFFASKDSSAALSSTEADAKTTSRAKNDESVSSTPLFDAAALAELQFETEKAFREVNRVSEKVSLDLKEIGEVIDSRIKLHGRPPADPQLESLEEMTRELKKEIRSLKERKCREEPLFFRQHAPKVDEEDSKIVVEDKVSGDPQTMSAEERRSRREMHVLKVRQQREKEMKLGKTRQESLVPRSKVNNAWGRKTRKDLSPAWIEILEEIYAPRKHMQPLIATRKDDPETLSGQIEKRLGAMAEKVAFAKTMEAQKRMEARKRKSLEILDLEPDQEAKKNDSLEWKEKLHSLAVRQQKFDKECGSFGSIDSMPNKETENSNSLKKGFSEKLQADAEFIFSQESETPSQTSESTDSSSSEEAEKDSSLDEDDIEIISRWEAESIPSDSSPSPPLPPKNRFRFGGKHSCFASLLRKKANKKPEHSPRDSAKSESSGISESESRKSSLSSAAPPGSNTEVKENPAFQESSSECLDGSKDVGPGNNPTLALRSSLAKYLEKNPESEWLATGKSSEQSKSAENSTKERVVPIFVQELDQWLPAGFNRRKEFSAVAKWRPTDCDWLFNADK